MSAYQTYMPRRFYRSADRAIFGGVCAGVADYFGLNLRVVRLLAVIAFCVATPMAVIVYLAIVFLIPARAGSGYEQMRWQDARRVSRKCRRAERKRARREAKQDSHVAASEAAAQVRSKCQSLEQRLASLEKYITSSRYQLDREFRNL